MLATRGTEAEARVRFVGEGWELLDSLYGLAEAAGDLKAMGLAMPNFDHDDIPPRDASPERVRARIEDAKKCWDRLRAVTTTVEKKGGFSVPWFSRNIYGGAFWGDRAYSWGTAVDGFYASLVAGTALPLPLKWRFQIDPKQEGEKTGWFQSDMDDSRWGNIRTDTCWENQGFGRERFPENGSDGYNGKAWYRVHVTIPESHKGEKTWLELGAVDESFTAWVNGKQCATFDFARQPDKDAWQKPHRIDITNAVRYGQDNIIAVEVVDLGGAGGIWKPCFVKFESKTNEIAKVQPVPVKNGTFQGKSTAPWTITGEGKFSFRLSSLVTGRNKRGLEVALGGDVKTGNSVTIIHPDLDASKLRLTTGKAYRLVFSLQGTPSGPVFRHPQIGAPFCVRVTYSQEHTSGKREYAYQWFSFYPSTEGSREAILSCSP